MQAYEVEAPDAVLHVRGTGSGPAVLVLSGGPGCVNYLADPALAPEGFRAVHPDPRGVGRSSGGPHDMERAVGDLEVVRHALAVERWIVVGHSWGSDLAVRYAVEHPRAVVGVVGVAGRGPQQDRTWSAAYEAGRDAEPRIEIDMATDVWESLRSSFTTWVQHLALWRDLANCPVPVRLLAAEHDVRPPWPLRQLAALVPHGSFEVVPGVPHDFWSTHPDTWRRTVTAACRAVLRERDLPGRS